ncbi:hypothetical protein JK151_08980 [Ralstonia syzygii subsp. celebesensis]|uniref:Uncharacterized protein n=2 Tax=Ralstonia syzygii subsp. celebesensis TaxID=1310168 RepID=A0A1U9VF30_9RALS|nr:hypothetical protein [Ralstonia syzygii]AQW29105.1 hypothetical protein B0B51_03145 [blood disease bacterium A2-HR MARDI]QQV54352.1 hypothetical protein JK151_08980 [Ralstonia syzygii subsp. celebesensis]CCA79391.1 hypothetical protein BDB_50103 [blood disease bacterium R229]
MTSKTAPKQPQIVNKTGARIANCSIVNTSAANEHTRAAVEALAHAAARNADAIADAIAEIARALKGAPATMEHGISLSHIGADV